MAPTSAPLLPALVPQKQQVTSFSQGGGGEGGRVETGVSVSLGPGSGRCKQIPALRRGKRGGGGSLLVYPEGWRGIKAPPPPAAGVSCWGESTGGGGHEGGGRGCHGRHDNTGCFLSASHVPGASRGAHCACARRLGASAGSLLSAPREPARRRPRDRRREAPGPAHPLAPPPARTRLRSNRMQETSRIDDD